jgi:transcriptional regulator NrdR family protein
MTKDPDMQKCPKGHRLKVVESIPWKVTGYRTIRRKKRCLVCAPEYRTTTFEIDASMFQEIFLEE